MSLDALHRDYRKVRYGTGVDSFAALGTMAGMEWISVTDRLPDELSRVLAVTAERGITIAWCRRERLGDLVWVTLDDCYGENVTHWMPFPEPPTD
jgi:hypothetical protein